MVSPYRCCVQLPPVHQIWTFHIISYLAINLITRIRIDIATLNFQLFIMFIVYGTPYFLPSLKFVPLQILKHTSLSEHYETWHVTFIFKLVTSQWQSFCSFLFSNRLYFMCGIDGRTDGRTDRYVSYASRLEGGLRDNNDHGMLAGCCCCWRMRFVWMPTKLGITFIAISAMYLRCGFIAYRRTPRNLQWGCRCRLCSVQLHRRRRRGQGSTCSPPPQKKKTGNIFFGQLLCKIRAFSGKNHVKLGDFVNFSHIFFGQIVLLP